MKSIVLLSFLIVPRVWATECLFGQYFDLDNERFEVLETNNLTVADIPKLEVLQVEQILKATKVKNLADAFTDSDETVIAIRFYARQLKQTFISYHFYPGDNQYGAIFFADSSKPIAKIQDGEIVDCQSPALRSIAFGAAPGQALPPGIEQYHADYLLGEAVVECKALQRTDLAACPVVEEYVLSNSPLIKEDLAILKLMNFNAVASDRALAHQLIMNSLNNQLRNIDSPQFIRASRKIVDLMGNSLSPSTTVYTDADTYWDISVNARAVIFITRRKDRTEVRVVYHGNTDG